MKKMYCLVVTDNYSRFNWVLFLASKDETSEILKTFISGIENLIDLKVKVIRCDNGTEFKNKVMNQFCEMKGIKREFSVARTPQQNGVAERKNRTLIEAARTMLADSKLPTTFWAEAVNTACYVQNKVLVIKPHNKTPYELFLGRKPALSFMRPFGCPVTILNTLDHLGKIDGKANEGFFVGYSTNRKAYRVFNSRTRIVEKNLHVKFSKETPNIAGNGPNWLFNINALTISMNYKTVVAGNQTNDNACTKENIDAGQYGKKIILDQEYILLPLLTFDPLLFKSSKDSPDAIFKPSGEEENMDSKHPKNEDSEVPNTEEPRVNQEQDANVNSTNNINTVCLTVNVADIENNVVDENIVYGCIDDLNMPNLEEIVYSDDDEEVGVETDMNNLATTVPVSPIPTTRVHKDQPLKQIIGDIHSAPQIRRMTKNVTEDGMFSSVQQRINHKDFQNCLFACFLSQVEPKKRAIGTKWVYRNKKDDKDDAQEIPDEFYGRAQFLLRIVASTPMETNKALLKDEKAVDILFQVTPKTSHLHAMKRIFRYLKDSPFDLEAFSDSDYVGASLDRKSTIGGCQFLGRRLISWDSYAKRLIQVIKIHTDHNVADLLKKAFDVSRFQYLIASIRMLNL
ncbi:putative ribonuclease H-like domain-containing protein [Tanacetum coccineum]